MNAYCPIFRLVLLVAYTCTALSLLPSTQTQAFMVMASAVTVTEQQTTALASHECRMSDSVPNENTGNTNKGDTDDSNSSANNQNNNKAGKLEELKQREKELSRLLTAVRLEKLQELRSRPLTIGIVGFGRFGQFIARTFASYGNVVVTSRSDYTEIANAMGVTYVPLDNPRAFLQHDLDVIVLAVSILSFEATVRKLVPPLQEYLHEQKQHQQQQGPLVVDVLSVKEHARQIMLQQLPPQCDILCTHPMFGPDSGKDSWRGLNFVYEKTRIDNVVLDPSAHPPSVAAAAAGRGSSGNNNGTEQFVDNEGHVHSVHEDSEAHVEGMDRMERFLSIWEEEGCRMVAMSCRDHDAYAANSQFITHLMGRILGQQGLAETPIDTRGFESVLKLVDSTTADSFDLFYGLYKFNQNSMDTIVKLRTAMDNVVDHLQEMDQQREEDKSSTVRN